MTRIALPISPEHLDETNIKFVCENQLEVAMKLTLGTSNCVEYVNSLEVSTLMKSRENLCIYLIPWKERLWDPTSPNVVQYRLISPNIAQPRQIPLNNII